MDIQLGQALMNTAGSALSTIGGLWSTGKTNKANKQMQEKAFQYNTDMWHLANNYNSPEMQMKRLESAGLNPNLVYGNGSVVGNTSTQTPKYQAPEIQRLPLENLNPMTILGQFYDLKTKSAQADLVKENKIAQSIQNRYLDMKLLQEQGLRFIAGQKGNAEIGRGDKQVMNSPYMQSYQAEVRSRQQQNALKDVELQFYKTIPKQYQWMAPLLLKLIN